VLFQRTVPPEDVAAIVIEPIQGEGGYVVPDARFMQQIGDICEKHGIMLIADEVQSGIGRTGKWWAIEHYDVQPDIVCSAKGIASGMPLGAIIAREEVMTWPMGSHGSTYGGNPISCAAALATLDLVENGYMANAIEQGAYIMDALEEMRPKHPTMKHARIDGKGLMVGVELVLDESRKPAYEVRNQTEQIALKNGLLALGAGKSAMRFCPPLMIEREHVEEGLRRFDASLEQAERDAGLL
jgi:4-aminobutyrate aminotransferase